MSIVLRETISQDGVAYYVQRARAMHVDEAGCALYNELQADPEFSECWRMSKDIYRDKVRSNPLHKWNNMEVHSRWALICYLLENPNVSRRVNHFCRQALPEPASWGAFPFKGLWFFLLRGFEMLPALQGAEVFRGVTVLSAMRNDNVPILQFLSTTRVYNEAVRFASPKGCILALHDVNPLYARDVSFYATNPDKKEVLIWPLATFLAIWVGGPTIHFHWMYGTTAEYAPRHRS